MGAGCPALPTLHRSVSIYLFGCLSVRQYICLSVCLSIWLPVYQAVYLFVCLPVCQAVYLFGCLSIRHYTCLLICLSICLFRSLSFCVSIYLSVHVSACRCFLPHWHTICWITSFYHLLTIPLILCNACNCLLFFSSIPSHHTPLCPTPIFLSFFLFSLPTLSSYSPPDFLLSIPFPQLFFFPPLFIQFLYLLLFLLLSSPFFLLSTTFLSILKSGSSLFQCSVDENIFKREDLITLHNWTSADSTALISKVLQLTKKI